MSLHDDLRRAGDPSTPLAELQDLAQNVPEARPYIAENPSTYPALIEWLAEFEDPDIHAALARRERAEAGYATTERGYAAETWEDPSPGREGASASEVRWDNEATSPLAAPYGESAETRWSTEAAAATDQSWDHAGVEDYDRWEAPTPGRANAETDADADDGPETAAYEQWRDEPDWDDQAEGPAHSATQDHHSAPWEPLDSASPEQARDADASRAGATASHASFWRRPAGILTALVGIVAAVALALTAISLALYAAGYRDSGLGGLAARVLDSGGSQTSGARNAAPEDTDNPGAAERGGTDAAQKRLALPLQERLVKDFPTQDTSNDVRPVPPAAYGDVPQFQVDNGKVVCTLSASHASCTIKETSQDYGNQGGPLVLSIDSSGTFAMTEPSEDPHNVGTNYPVLSANAAVSAGQMACQSSGTSVECWNAVSGHGFTAGNGQVGQF